MGILAYIVFGLIVGVVANMIDPRAERGGILGAIVLGVLGAIVGGFLGSLLIGADVSGFNITSFILAIGGALLLLLLGRAMNRRAI